MYEKCLNIGLEAFSLYPVPLHLFLSDCFSWLLLIDETSATSVNTHARNGLWLWLPAFFNLESIAHPLPPPGLSTLNSSVFLASASQNTREAFVVLQSLISNHPLENAYEQKFKAGKVIIFMNFELLVQLRCLIELTRSSLDFVNCEFSGGCVCSSDFVNFELIL